MTFSVPAPPLRQLPQVSAMLTDDWFGSTDDLSHVVDSRWAHTPAEVQVSGDQLLRRCARRCARRCVSVG